MEVHHHDHGHGKKNWKSYFWEFLMLFLAVFCGFLAEYQLEHVIENQREKRYAISLMEDIINDTIELTDDIPFWERMNSYGDTIRMELEKESDERNSLRLYHCTGLLINHNRFIYHDRTISQLKHSGNFRLIRKKTVADSLVTYDGFISSVIQTMQDEYYNIFRDREVLQDQLFNSKFYQYIYTPEKFFSMAKSEPHIIEIAKGKDDILFQYYNHLYDMRFHFRARIRFLKMTKSRAVNLIELIKKEYHL